LDDSRARDDASAEVQIRTVNECCARDEELS